MSLYGDFIYGDQYYDEILTYEDYQNILRLHNRQPRLKVNLMYSNMEVYQEITSDIILQGSSLNISNKNGIRRTITLELANPQLRYNVEPNNIWMNTYFSVYAGYYYNGRYYWFLLGIFITTNPVMSSGLSQSTITLRGYDKMSLLNGTLSGKLEGIYQIEASDNMREIINSIVTERGDTFPVNYDSIFEGYLIPYTITTDLGNSYFSILDELASLRSSNVFYDTNGCLNFQSGIEDLDDSVKPPLYSFSNDGTDINYISSNATFDFEKVCNCIYVQGSTVDGGIYSATLKDENLESPTRIQLIGERWADPITDDNINSDALCLDRAKYELKKLKTLWLTVEINCVPIPDLDVNCVIELTDDRYDFDHLRLLIQSISYNLQTGGTMSLSCTSVNELEYSNI